MQPEHLVFIKETALVTLRVRHAVRFVHQLERPRAVERMYAVTVIHRLSARGSRRIKRGALPVAPRIRAQRSPMERHSVHEPAPQLQAACAPLEQ